MLFINFSANDYFFFAAAMDAVLRFGEPSQGDVFDSVSDSNELLLSVLTCREIEIAYKTLGAEKTPTCHVEKARERPNPSERYRGLFLYLR